MQLFIAFAFFVLLVCPSPVFAADLLPQAELGLSWAVPFAGLLLSIAFGPLLAPHFWHQHYGKIVALWATLLLGPLIATFGHTAALKLIVGVLFLEYLPFLALVGSLYVVASGVTIRGHIVGAPVTNTLILATGAGLASLIGTTGAAMLMLQPLIRANLWRENNVHIFVFYIFLVANVGGSLSAIGDPPLFLGFLRGVDFFWPTIHLIGPTLLLASILLLLFYIIDKVMHARETGFHEPEDADTPVTISGLMNVGLLLLMVGIIIATGTMEKGQGFTLLGIFVDGPSLLRSLLLIGCAAFSLRYSNPERRKYNAFSWEPVKEVGKLFAGIFVTLAPVVSMLHAGESGALGGLMAVLKNPQGAFDPFSIYLVAGSLSSFLDNAPTYVVFFEAVGGNPQELMGPLAHLLMAISMATVYFGAMSYIGNAPNFMVRSIVEGRGIRMPSFFGFFGWACVCLLPCLLFVGWLTFVFH